MAPKTLSTPVPLRLEPDQKALLEAEAQRLNIPLQQLIRDRLTVQAAAIGAVETLRREVVYALGRTPSAGPANRPAPSGLVTDALMIELLLAMRQVLNPTQLRSIQNEIVELGLTPWTGEGR